jgi:hypothetical protein
MDIFTAQLTRVVNLPIKPAKLKVKAPKKEAASTKLSQDLDHLENHNAYFSDEEHSFADADADADADAEKVKTQQLELFANFDSASVIANKFQKNTDGTVLKKDKKVSKHLDLYA